MPPLKTVQILYRPLWILYPWTPSLGFLKQESNKQTLRQTSWEGLQRVKKRAGRQGGAILLLPGPAGLPHGPPLDPRNSPQLACLTVCLLHHDEIIVLKTS